MKPTPSERRLAENEVVFREANEQVQEGMTRLRKSAKAGGFDDLYQNKSGEQETPLHFYCECADEKCRQRIIMTPSKFKELHSSSTRFVIKPGHQVPEVERVILEDKQFMVVDKMVTPPRHGDKLNPTKLDNTKE
jgi:hypothetical protein